MPEVGNPKLLSAVVHCSKIFLSQFKPSLQRMPVGARTTHFIDARDLQYLGKTKPIETDTANRSSGKLPFSTSDSISRLTKGGTSALYCALQRPYDIESNFHELMHYLIDIKSNSERDKKEQTIEQFYSYERGKEPQYFSSVKGKYVKKIYNMQANKAMKGIDLTFNYRWPEATPSVELFRVAQNMAELYPEDYFEGFSNLKSQYQSRSDDEAKRKIIIEMLRFHYGSEDASFHRALGNSFLEIDGVDFLWITSLRGGGTNLLVKGESGAQVKNMTACERFTAFEQDGKVVFGYTKDDMIYNQNVIRPGNNSYGTSFYTLIKNLFSK